VRSYIAPKGNATRILTICPASRATETVGGSADMQNALCYGPALVPELDRNPRRQDP